MWISKKKHKAMIEQVNHLQEEVNRLEKIIEEVNDSNDRLRHMLYDYQDKYPFEIGQVVYDVQLRSANGRYTKTKACREHSLINEVVVDKKNYFNLVERSNKYDVFVDKSDAESHLDAVCVD